MFPEEHDSRVQDLLLTMAHWHSLVKLRMHTDRSLSILDAWTTILREDSRDFLNLTCKEFNTRELKREYEARKRREARKGFKGKKTTRSAQALHTSVTNRTSRRIRTISSSTPISHSSLLWSELIASVSGTLVTGAVPIAEASTTRKRARQTPLPPAGSADADRPFGST